MAAGTFVLGAVVLSVAWVRFVVDVIESGRRDWHDSTFGPVERPPVTLFGDDILRRFDNP